MNNRSRVFWMTKVRPREQRNELSMLIYCYVNKIKQMITCLLFWWRQMIQFQPLHSVYFQLDSVVKLLQWGEPNCVTLNQLSPALGVSSILSNWSVSLLFLPEAKDSGSRRQNYLWILQKMVYHSLEIFYLKEQFKVCVTKCRALLNVDLSKDYTLALEINVSQNNSIWETQSCVLVLSQELRGLSHDEGRILSNRRNKKSSVSIALPGDPLDYYQHGIQNRFGKHWRSLAKQQSQRHMVFCNCHDQYKQARCSN